MAVALAATPRIVADVGTRESDARDQSQQRQGEGERCCTAPPQGVATATCRGAHAYDYMLFATKSRIHTNILIDRVANPSASSYRLPVKRMISSTKCTSRFSRVVHPSGPAVGPPGQATLACKTKRVSIGLLPRRSRVKTRQAAAHRHPSLGRLVALNGGRLSVSSLIGW